LTGFAVVTFITPVGRNSKHNLRENRSMRPANELRAIGGSGPSFIGATKSSGKLLIPDDRVDRKHGLAVLETVVPGPRAEGVLVAKLRADRE
jgi:hypothetical protein